MKQWIALLLVLAMLVCLATACGPTDPVDQPSDEPDTPDVLPDVPTDDPTDDPSSGDTPSDTPEDPVGGEDVGEETEPDRYAPYEGTHESAAAQRKEYELVTADGYYDGPYLVQTVYPTEQTVVANIIATDAPYNADPTGKKDSTAAIQAALDACGAMGGGTVFLPVGEYLVTSTVKIPIGVVLHGDWQDPDLTDDPQYGTVILAKPEPLSGDEIYDQNAKPLFDLSTDKTCNNGIVGLTVYYPDQSVDEVIPYGYTIYNVKPQTVTVRNVTLINSYRALGMGPYYETGYEELVQIESVRVTALSQGYKAMRSSEIGYTVDLRISPRYWVNAAERYACADAAALREWCRENTVGMEMEQIDMNQYTDLFLDGCQTALLMQNNFWGGIYGLDIRDSVYGVVAKNVRGATGVLIANGAIEADEYAVLNVSTNLGTVKLTDVKLMGKGSLYAVEGASIVLDDTSDLSDYDIEYGSYQQPAPYLYVADLSDYHEKKVDAAEALQAVLDSAEETGGIVYIPRGVYSFYTPLYVPAGVELRGASMTLARDRADVYYEPTGTCLLSYVLDTDFITLDDGAGVYGLRIFYGSFDNFTALSYLERDHAVTDTCVAVRGVGDGVYCLNMVIANAFVAVDFTDCDGHLIKQTFGCAFNNFIRAGGKGGHIEQVLANQTFTYHQPFNIRNLYDPDYHNAENWKTYNYAITQDERFSLIRDTLLRSYCDTVYLKDAEDETMVNVFMYGCRRILRADHASATCYNVISDWQSMNGMFKLENGSEVVAINPYRTAGGSHEVDDSSALTLYNRMQGGKFDETALLPGQENVTFTEDDVLDIIEVCDGDSIDERITGLALNSNAAFVKEGEGSLKVEKATVPAYILFDPVDASTLGDNVYLHLWLYIDETINAAWKANSLVLANTSNGMGVVYQWALTSYVTANGWNELWLPLADGWRGKGEPDMSSLQHLYFSQAFNHLNEYPDMYLDDIYLCALPENERALTEVELDETVGYKSPVPAREIIPSRVMLNNCDTPEELTGNVKSFTKVNTDPRFVKEGAGSLRIDVKGNIYTEMKFPATDIGAYDKTGYLHMWFYIDDISLLGGTGQIELCSGGVCDVGEKNWSVGSYVKESGWNELWLPLSSAVSKSPVPYEPSHVNYIRIYSSVSDKCPTIYIDDIYVCNVPDGSLYDESNTGKTGTGDPALRLPIIHTCDNTSGMKNVTLNTDPAMIKEGAGSLAATTNDVRLIYSCDAVDVSAYMNGYLHMWIYVGDVSAIRAGQIEMTSSGTCDKEEIGWTLAQYVKENGWTELYLPLSEVSKTGGEFNPKAFNYIRIYALVKDGVRDLVPIYFDDIRFVQQIGD